MERNPVFAIMGATHHQDEKEHRFGYNGSRLLLTSTKGQFWRQPTSNNERNYGFGCDASHLLELSTERHFL